MKASKTVQSKWQWSALLALAAFPYFSPAAQSLPTRNPRDDVKSPSVRMRPGLMPKDSMLFNGWGVTPAGEPVAISEMPLKFVVSPDQKTLLAASGGYNDTGLTLLDLKKGQVIQFLPLPQVWNGRFQFMGGGGTDGSVRPAWGFANNGSSPALASGYAPAGSRPRPTSPADQDSGLQAAGQRLWRLRWVFWQLVTWCVLLRPRGR